MVRRTTEVAAVTHGMGKVLTYSHPLCSLRSLWLTVLPNDIHPCPFVAQILVQYHILRQQSRRAGHNLQFVLPRKTTKVDDTRC